MRLLALAACWLASAASGQAQHTHIRSGGLSRSFPNKPANGPILSFLPTGSWSSANECAGTALAGTKGEALTFARASSAVCTKTDGTLVTVTSNQPRLQGTGLLVEGANTNLAIRSQEFDNAAWTKTSVTAPTADTQVAPDGTTTAEVLAATGAGGLVESTAAAITGSNGTASVYVKTTSGTQSMAIILRDTTAAADRCTGTLTATTTWQRVSCSSAAVTTTNSHTVRIYPGGVAGTGTVVAWGAQQEASAVVSSYVATAGTSVTRAAENATLAVPAAMTDASGCIAATINTPAVTGTPRVIGVSLGAPQALLYVNGTTIFSLYDGTGFVTSTAASLVGVPSRAVTAWSGSTVSITRPGGTVSGAYDGSWPLGASLAVGAGNSSGYLFGTISDIQFGAAPGACQ